jgi:hypothetical protein
MEIKGGEGRTLVWNLVVGCSGNVTYGQESVLDLGFSTKNEVSWTSVLLVCSDPSTP